MTLILDELEQIANVLKGETDTIRQQPAITSLGEIADYFAAATSHPGVIEIATEAEAKAGTAASLALTPAVLMQSPPAISGTIAPVFFVHYQFTPAAVSATGVHAAIAMTDAAQDITAAITNPDFPRTVTVKGNAAGITGDVVITGTNIAGATIIDTIALNAATEVEGVKAFKTVTNIHLPAETHAGTDTVSVGIAKKFGIPHVAYKPGMLIVKLFDGSADSGTLAVDAAIEKNLFALNGTPNGAKVTDLIYGV